MRFEPTTFCSFTSLELSAGSLDFPMTGALPLSYTPRCAGYDCPATPAAPAAEPVSPRLHRTIVPS